MPRIGRNLYQTAIVKILKKNGFEIQSQSVGKLVVVKNGRRFLVDVSGRNLPYYGFDGKEGFPWETHLKADRLDRIEKYASKEKAEPFLGFCYYILDPTFESEFKTVVSIGNKSFGAKFIRTSEYRDNMQKRSPSWSQVELPRRKVLDLLCNPEEL
jgi:hypothetical protein